MKLDVDEWVRAQYTEKHCDKYGRLGGAVNLERFLSRLIKLRPDIAAAITDCVQRLDIGICEHICQAFPTNKHGKFTDVAALSEQLVRVRPDLKNDAKRDKLILRLQEIRKANLQRAAVPALAKPLSVPPGGANDGPSHAHTTTTDESLQVWISSLYPETGFKGAGFIGWAAFSAALVKAKPARSLEIRATLKDMRLPGHKFSLVEANKEPKRRAAKQQEGGIRLTETPVSKKAARDCDDSVNKHKFLTDKRDSSDSDQRSSVSIEDSASEDITSENSQSEQSYCAPSEEYQEPNFGLIDQLITRRGTTSTDTILPEAIKRDIGHAPLVSASVIVKYGKDLVPQYGFLGSKGTEGEVIKLFHNTNVPFSTFICGVQGSGKSHTTACMLENALIPSQQLGRLQAPVAALVFSYSEFSSGGSGFTLSEAAFLGSANQDTASQKVKKITVLVSPSNPAIKKFYRAIPGIKVLEFKLRAKSLDIATLLTLMGMNEKSDVPLYMAKVESILRAIATENEDGVFDYSLFKQKIAMENFDPKQTNMLDMRLGLLESFLDKDENTPEPTFRPGEITIMDLSDPFITPNTACILFKLGLERFTQSRALGKMVVLDEAHKYMLNTPGSKMLTGHLATLIRLQRHKGVRVIISTQEPTLSTDLIALCSVTVIHRFTSPAWYSALKKHINAMENDEEILRQIESLETGEALVYAPNAVMGKEEDGTLIKLPGQLLKLNIRKRITKDGGESIMAI